MHLDHVGVATDDAAGLAALYETLLDCPVVHEELFDGMRVVFCDCGSSYLELIEPVEEGGAIARFLDRNGPGLHHLAFEIDDLAATLAVAREHGIELLDEEPRPGAWGHRVAFCHPKSTGGVLVEFVEH